GVGCLQENSPRTIALPADLRGNNARGDSNGAGEHGRGMISRIDAPSTMAHFSTVIVPFMRGWYLQEYLNVPALANLYSNVSSGLMLPDLKLLSSAMTVWSWSSSFFQTTVSPTFTVSSLGL